MGIGSAAGAACWGIPLRVSHPNETAVPGWLEEQPDTAVGPRGGRGVESSRSPHPPAKDPINQSGKVPTVHEPARTARTEATVFDLRPSVSTKPGPKKYTAHAQLGLMASLDADQ